MRTFIRILAALTLVTAAQPPSAHASIARVSGPIPIFRESLAFVSFDMAFDEVNRVYLVVWGTQGDNDSGIARARGLFLDAAGNPIFGPFNISDGPRQAGWARVAYSAEENRFLVTYTKMSILQRAARFVTWQDRGAVGPEIVLDNGVGGNNPGLAYSARSRKWLVTWWKWVSPFSPYPTSYVGVIDAATGAYSGPKLVSNPGDGQSDPDIACDPSSGRCLVAGYGWGIPLGEVNSTWGRFVDDSTGDPIAPPFYVHYDRVEGESTLVFNSTSKQFVVGYSRNMDSVWASTVSPTGAVAGPYLVRGPDGTCPTEGSGYGRPAMANNAGTGTVLVGMIDRCNVAAAQEIDGQMVPTAGFERLPGAASQFVTVAADAGLRRYLLADNQRFFDGRSTLYTADGVAPPPVRRRITDFNRDGKQDIAVFRPSDGIWYVHNYFPVRWGAAGDIPVPGDYDGDGVTDIAVWRPSTGQWFILTSSTGYLNFWIYDWGTSGDVPIPADFDGDGRAEIAIWRPATGEWFIRLSTTNFGSYSRYAWGIATDTPIAADFDGDGRAEIGVWRAATGRWYLLWSSRGYLSHGEVDWGTTGDTPLTGDYDGDGRAEIGVWRPSNGHWYVRLSSTNWGNYREYGWGAAGDTAVDADFDGDGLSDLVVWRPSTGQWIMLGSASQYATYAHLTWGVAGDLAVPAIR